MRMIPTSEQIEYLESIGMPGMALGRSVPAVTKPPGKAPVAAYRLGWAGRANLGRGRRSRGSPGWLGVRRAAAECHEWSGRGCRQNCAGR